MDQDALDSFERRIQQLEKMLGIDENFEHNDKIDGLAIKLQKIEQSTKCLQLMDFDSFIEKYNKLEVLLQNAENISQYVLSAKQKSDLIILNSPKIEQMQSDLVKVEKLKRYLDFPPFQNNQDKISTLASLQQDSGDIMEKFLYQNDKMNKIIELNSEIINQLNKKFVYYDCLLTQLK